MVDGSTTHLLGGDERAEHVLADAPTAVANDVHLSSDRE